MRTTVAADRTFPIYDGLERMLVNGCWKHGGSGRTAEKNSGVGRYNGEWSIEEFTTVHRISVQHEPRV